MIIIDTLIWYFFIYAIIGYVIEVIYCSVGEQKLVNRGFLHGPWLPIYGIGGILIILSTAFVVHSPLLVFLVTLVVTSVLEYIGSLILEQVFSIKLWDYSLYPLNINGRVCAKNSTLFGLLGIAVIYGVHPRVQSFVAAIPQTLRSSSATIISVVIAVDASISVMRLISFTTMLERYQKRKVEIEARLVELAHSRQNRTLAAWLEKEKRELHEQLLKAAERIFSKFPSVTSGNHERRGLLRRLQAASRERKEQRRVIRIAQKEERKRRKKEQKDESTQD